MRSLKRIFFLAVIIVAGYYFIMNQDLIERDQTELDQKEILLEKKRDYETENLSSLDIELVQWIGKSLNELIQTYGEPIRKDLSAYEYTWYVYQEEDHRKYLLFGVENDEIVTAYVTGSEVDLDNIFIGQDYAELDNEFSFTDEVQYEKGTSMYTFKLHHDDRNERPLVKINNNLFMQFYFDTVTEALVAVRVVKGDILLLHQDYEIEYRGNLPAKKSLSDEEWDEINRGQEEQIFELSNVIRDQHDYPTLSWEEDVSDVAFLHSKDMADHDYFSHENLSGDGLTERLSSQNITYQLAGENIAANYPDALATVVGWLNSEGHRESLFNDQFTHLGVGVYELYYTQNFLRK